MSKDIPGLPVKGYAPTQTLEAIAAVNKLKVLEEKFLRELDTLTIHLQNGNAPDQHWLSIARTHIQEGTMAAARAIFKPTRLEGPLE